MTLQIVRDWALRFNADGPQGLATRKVPGPRTILDDGHRHALEKIIEAGPIPAAHGVVRWRIIDLVQWLWDEFKVSISKQALGHERVSVREKTEAAGEALRFLPPYSPDFNPIEKAFSRLKAMLRKVGERIISGLWEIIGRLTSIFQPSECANYFSSCRYEPE